MQDQKQKNPNDNLDNLAKRLEKELGAKKVFTQFDLRGEKTKEEKSPEIVQIENEMQEKDFSNQTTNQQDNLQNQNKTKQVISDFIKSKAEKKEKESRLNQNFINEIKTETKTNNQQSEIKKVFKRTIIYLVLIEIILYILSLITFISSFLLSILIPLVLILDLIIYIWLYIKFFKSFSLPNKKAISLVMQTGLWVGFLRSIFKVIWVNQFWTIPNILIETILSGLGAFVIAFLISKILKNKLKATSSDSKNY